MKALVLRNCRENGESKNGFIWNTEIGAVNTCPDWRPTNECGNGLHGWLWGEGSSNVSDYNDSPLWLVLEVEDKIKCESCVVAFKGNMAECANYIFQNGGEGKRIIGLTGDYLEAGDLSCLATNERDRIQKSGDRSTQTAGDSSTQTAGDESNHKIGNDCKVKTGLNSIVIHRWWNEEWRLKVFVITEEQANKTFHYENGEQTEVTETEIAGTQN